METHISQGTHIPMARPPVCSAAVVPVPKLWPKVLRYDVDSHSPRALRADAPAAARMSNRPVDDDGARHGHDMRICIRLRPLVPTRMRNCVAMCVPCEICVSTLAKKILHRIFDFFALPQRFFGALVVCVGFSWYLFTFWQSVVPVRHDLRCL